jgi:hypothetical protein
MIEVLINKVTNNREYLAWYFHEYMRIEKKSIDELLKQLDVNQEGFYKAALCKAPPESDPDFAKRINQTADYISMSVLALVHIIRSVNNNIAFNDIESINAALMAAREKPPFTDTSNSEMKDDR